MSGARARRAGIALCFFLSGAAALLYETAWMRRFAIALGTSEEALATVLAGYMGGLAAGAALGARLAPRVRRPVLVYGLLELAIALAALALPYGVALLERATAALFGGAPELGGADGALLVAFETAGCFLLLALPAGLMGATLPLLARDAVERDDEVGPRIGALYAWNTLGAVAGLLVTADLLLPALGLARTVRVGVGINALVFVLAALLARGAPARNVVPRNARAASPLASRWVLPAIALSGFTAFGYEVLWTRLFAQVVGVDLEAFAAMLASFLGGIALGSALAARLARGRRAAAAGFALAQLGAGLASLALHALLPRVAALAGAGAAPLLALCLLPATLFLGACFPFAVRLAAPDADSAARASGVVYAWNTLGAIAGALAAGFALLPALGFDGTLVLLAGINGLLALVASLASRVRLLALPLAGALVAAWLLSPTPPLELLRHSPLEGVPADGRVAYLGVGRSATVLALERDGRFDLRGNGLPEATVEPAGAPPAPGSMRWFPALCVLARPQTRTLLVVGMGGGVALERVPASVERIAVIELEPEVVAANRAIADRRRRDPLADPRLSITIGDARGALALTEARWDAVVSQPSHPFTPGASHLYTREFLELVRAHLEPGGVLLQWMHADFVDAEQLRQLGATLLAVFAHVRSYRSAPGALLLLASDAPLEPERTAPAALAADPGAYLELGLRLPEDLAAHLAFDEPALRELCAGAALVTDDTNRLALRRPAPALGARGLAELIAARDPLLRDPPAFAPSAPAYLAHRVGQAWQPARARALAEGIEDAAERALALGWTAPLAGASGEPELRAALALRPDDADARFLFVLPWLDALAAGEAAAETRALAAELRGAEAAVVEGWRRARADELEALRALEPALAGARPAAACRPAAELLRATWRARAGDVALAREALLIVDAVLAVHPWPEAYELRLEAALAAASSAHALESAAALLARLERVPGSARGVDGDALRAALALLRVGGRVDAGRLGALEERAAAMLP